MKYRTEAELRVLAQQAFERDLALLRTLGLPATRDNLEALAKQTGEAQARADLCTPEQPVYELHLRPTGHILLTGERFLDGFHEGYFRSCIAQRKGLVTDEEFTGLMMEQLTNSVYQPSCFPGGVALGYVVGMLGYKESDW